MSLTRAGALLFLFFGHGKKRYDCRGYLYDLSEYDADLIARRKDTNGVRYSSEEIEIENMCDEERYMFLNEILNENSSMGKTTVLSLFTMFLAFDTGEELLLK